MTVWYIRALNNETKVNKNSNYTEHVCVCGFILRLDESNGKEKLSWREGKERGDRVHDSIVNNQRQRHELQTVLCLMAFDSFVLIFFFLLTFFSLLEFFCLILWLKFSYWHILCIHMFFTTLNSLIVFSLLPVHSPLLLFFFSKCPLNFIVFFYYFLFLSTPVPPILMSCTELWCSVDVAQQIANIEFKTLTIVTHSLQL